jgi:hypothetical protein
VGASPCFRERKDGIDLFVRLTPKSSADRIEGEMSSSAVAVRAPPRPRWRSPRSRTGSITRITPKRADEKRLEASESPRMA